MEVSISSNMNVLAYWRIWIPCATMLTFAYPIITISAAGPVISAIPIPTLYSEPSTYDEYKYYNNSYFTRNFIKISYQYINFLDLKILTWYRHENDKTANNDKLSLCILTSKYNMVYCTLLAQNLFYLYQVIQLQC